ncbi:DUF1120 domain-containing protein [Pseudomonas sp. JUb96]|uniref:DUF1120 domain-containing protein n=1 Tax=Pseudomonas sp. JUb96 TaxID=2940539 RepID=UPI002226846F|nr:DUF1120 domain-containing protein [Pseudomonas sp. JUb96]MCW2267538.1 hypothetical protein [Pseudomonas sp. JUb96]
MRISVASFSLLATLASTHVIASTSDVTLTGTLTPSACTPALSNGGVIDYGPLFVDDLDTGPTVHYQLPVKQLDLTIKCEAATPFALVNFDNRIDNATGSVIRFGLGTHKDEVIGYMFIQATTALVDGVVRHTITSRDRGENWVRVGGTTQEFERAQLRPDFLLGFGDLSDVASGPTPAKDLSTTLTVTGRADSRIDYSSDVQIDGSTTFEVRYL